MENNVQMYFSIINQELGFTRDDLEYPESLIFTPEELRDVTSNPMLLMQDTAVNTFAHQLEPIHIHVLAEITTGKPLAVLVQNENGDITEEIIL